jgi:hypothetical protein
MTGFSLLSPVNILSVLLPEFFLWATFGKTYLNFPFKHPQALSGKIQESFVTRHSNDFWNSFM